MNPPIGALCLISVTFLLLPLRAAPDAPWWNSPDKQSDPGVTPVGGYMDESDHSGTVPVDVVVDMTDAGKKIARPSPNKPAYYLPLPVGYKDWGYEPFYQRTRPSAPDVEALIEREFSKQGYAIMTHQHHPSLVLAFFWGYMADVADSGGVPAPPGYMTTLIWGDTMIYGYANGSWISQVGAFHDGHYTDYRLLSLLNVPGGRFYVLVSAFNFQAWLHHKPILLWRAHISTLFWGHYFDEVLPTLIATAAPMLGRETSRPQVIEVPVIPMGRVTVGAPYVKDYPTGSAPPIPAQH